MNTNTTFSCALLLACLLGAAQSLGPCVGAAQAQQEAGRRATVTLEIRGMVTRNCPVLVRAAVSKIKGVERVSASLERKSATVVYDPSKTSPQRIQAVIKDQVGFDSRLKG